MNVLSPHAVMRYRLSVGGVSTRDASLADAARSGLQDGSPWSGLLSLHARARSVRPDSWKDPSLAQVFGPRGAVYLVPRDDIAVFTVGLMPSDPSRRAEITRAADAVRSLVANRPMSQREVLAALPDLGGVRELRWAGATGQILPLWDTRDTVIHAGEPPKMEPVRARRELVRRFYRFLGPATVGDLAWWLDTTRQEARDVTDGLRDELTDVPSSMGRLLVTHDSRHLLDAAPEPPLVVMLPPDDPIINRRTARPWLDAGMAADLWPKAPPPGAVLVDGVVVGTWRRRRNHVTIEHDVALRGRSADDLVTYGSRFPLLYDGNPTVEFRHTRT